ncbi:MULTISPECIES: heparinase II/III domain-containing protein [unclassified Chitinophaga]|uniref:heparinase II/III domain-containing protein n=1 Tax=unclassified Chitinophaga TaxID=2619133 RepID=UPI0030100094
MIKSGFFYSVLIGLHILIPACVLAQEKGKPAEIPAYVAKPEREPGYPLKQNRMIYTEKDVQVALNNIQHYVKAGNIRDGIVQEANQWLGWKDEDLRSLLTDAVVPRAFDLNPLGCPQHGDAVFKKGGTYPWIIDPREPFKVKCPVGGETYPSNDYGAYYKSGFTQKKGWDGDYTDSGWGWIAPDGERYWFVAYANHWLWKSYIEPAILNLGRAYLLTGDKRYAHKAAVMLYRLAEVYPSMDHANQSRYGYILKQQGGVYNGKIFNLIWETGFIQNIAEAYDAVWDSIDDDVALQKLYGKSGRQIRAAVEANVLEEAVDAYQEFKIQGNYGMHQAALLYVLLARQFMETGKYIHKMVDEPGVSRVQTGIRYALYNMIFRDGTPLESPGYNILTVEKLAVLGALLKRAGKDLFGETRMRMMFESPLQMVVAKKYTPDIGDSGSTLGGIVGLNSNIYQVAYENYGTSEFLNWLKFMDKTGDNSFNSYQSLFRHVIKDTLREKVALAPENTRLLAGYGMGILNNKNDNIGVSFNYGYKGTHYHWDFLNVELFANGQKMMPDLGYPDAMNEFVKEVYTWSTNTVSHSTVVVDAQEQYLNTAGSLHSFSDGTFARSMDASTLPYGQVSEYRRNVVMVDADTGRSYFVDFFRVTGGHQHDYSLHGPPGTEKAIQGKWSGIQPGTFAGPDIKPGEIYDNQKMNAPGYTGSYGSYRGSGYQHLFNVQQLKSNYSVTEFAHIKDSSARLRIHVLPDKEQRVFKADAFNKPRAKDYIIKYLLVQGKSAGEQDTLKSIFTSVWEPFATVPFISHLEKLPIRGGDARAVKINRDHFVEIVINDTGNAVKYIPALDIETDATTAVVTLGAGKKLHRVYYTNGTFLKWKNRVFRSPVVEGIISAVDVKNNTISIMPGRPVTDAAKYEQQIVHVYNAYRKTVHPVAIAEYRNGILKIKTSDDLLIGRLTADSIDNRKIYTKTTLPFAALYKGATLLDAGFQPQGVITRLTEDGEIETAGKPTIRKGNDLWISNVGTGEKIIIHPMFSWVEK